VFDRWKRQRQEKAELKNRLKIFNARTKQLEEAMDKLYSEHMSIAKINDVYLLMSSYVQTPEKWEHDYCKDYITKKYSGAYDRYDKECQ